MASPRDWHDGSTPHRLGRCDDMPDAHLSCANNPSSTLRPTVAVPLLAGNGALASTLGCVMSASS